MRFALCGNTRSRWSVCNCFFDLGWDIDFVKYHACIKLSFTKLQALHLVKRNWGSEDEGIPMHFGDLISVESPMVLSRRHLSGTNVPLLWKDVKHF